MKCRVPTAHYSENPNGVQQDDRSSIQTKAAMSDQVDDALRAEFLTLYLPPIHRQRLRWNPIRIRINTGFAATVINSNRN
jgi:hypothetical protein